ncbi:MAG TPA: 50S ribosomal protein L21 [Candidatus Limnocylindrales bacterium]|nr:50S ribosomal protein L21 [Candidatus Limnocylindrales bacterium]
MYAVIETGGKQYRVEVGTELEVELLDGAAGDSIKLERILLVADGDTAAIGRPIVEGASVAAEVVRRDRGEKLISFKYRPKARRRVKKGHRQELTILRISDIVLNGKSAADEKAEADKARKAERDQLEATARKQAAADAALAAKLAADSKPSKAEAAADKKAAPAKRGAAEADAKTAAAKTAAAKTADSKKSAPKSSSTAKSTSTTKSKSTATRSTRTSAKPAAKAPATKPTPKAAPKRGTTKKDS